MKKILILLFVAIMCIPLYACGESKTLSAAESYIGTNYETVIREIKELGFENIETKEVKDLTTTSELQEGDVGEISINGVTDFEAGAEFEKKAPVIITYHMLKVNTVKIHIDFIPNLFLNKYDVLFSLNEEEFTLPHGEDGDFEFELKDGSYIASFVSTKSSVVKGEQSFDISCDTSIAFKINCESDNIDTEIIYIDKEIELAEDEAKIMNPESDFYADNYKTVISTLKEWGFTNISEKPLYDITFGITSNGSVEEVIIGGSTDYKRGDVLKKDTPVLVFYHMDTNEDPSKVKMPYDNSTASGVNYEEVVDAFKEAGFTNISVKEEATYDTSGNVANTVASIKVDDLSFYSVGDAFYPDSKVTISYYVVVEAPSSDSSSSSSSKSSTELNSFYAKNAFGEYGDSIYPYGFKCHWFTNLINMEQYDDGSWFIKVGVTVENAYGNKVDAIAEGRVAGTDVNPVIVQFNVY